MEPTSKPIPAPAQPRQELHLIPAGRDQLDAPGLRSGLTVASHAPTARKAEQTHRPTLEQFTKRQGKVRLLARFSPNTNPTVNGEPAAALFVLAPGDEVHWLGDDGGFRVALFTRPDMGPPPDALIGKPCPVCRVPFQKQTRCIRCLCGSAMHCEPEGKDSLQCAPLRGSCPVCNRPVTTKEGYVEDPAD